ncbi:response regulator [Paenibacillus algorifonticola]|uniref:response regulator n=1 Tax=Paenibacillus algorifonticola TaxID=684063 RepID=UPI003D292FA8
MKVILVDDECLALDYLERQLVKLNNVEVLGKYADPMNGKERILRDLPDVVFLDINLPEVSGIALAEQLLEVRPELNIVFVTAYDEYAVKAFELNALDYVVKPIHPERLMKTMERIQRRLDSFAKEKEQTVQLVKKANEEQHLVLQLLGQFSVEFSGKKDAAIRWRTTKAQELFLYLLQHREQLVRKSILIDLLWPDNGTEKIYAQLYTTVYHIRKTLDQFGKCFHIANTTEGYILTLNQVVLDVEEWERGIAAAPPLAAATLAEYEEAMNLYRGDYLKDYDYWWAESERQRLKRLWLNTSYRLEAWHVEHGQLDKAIAGYIRIIEEHAQAEEAYFALMQLYASKGNHLMVNQQYHALTTVLMEELNEQPSAYITEWYKEWKSSFSTL